MAITAKALFNPLQAAATEVSQYVTPAATRTIIDKFTGTNTTGVAATLTVRLVPSGGAAGVTNTIVSAKNLAAGEAYTFPEVDALTAYLKELHAAPALDNVIPLSRHESRSLHG